MEKLENEPPNSHANLNITIDTLLKENLKQHCKKTGINMNSTVKWLIKDYLRNNLNKK